MKISGSVIMITGGARRVGRVVAQELAKSGARLVLHYNSSETEAASLKRSLQTKFKSKVVLVQGNLKKWDQLQEIVRQGWDAFGKVDVLVNNASTFYPTPLGKVREEQWDDLFDVNAKAPFFLGEALGLKMKRRKKGKILNIADWSANRPYTQYVPYCASKAALVAVSRGLAKSLAPEVQVQTILPGPVMWPQDLGEKAKQQVLKQTPLKRMGSPQDVASAVKFLIEGNDFMTGTELHVDGGRHL